ncbi:carboxyltransferase domain-containing protein [Cellulomonas shaoxiangyii]|uniref:5-oxoprolinase subunit B/C family protein n=2 Tax=Cellulomonas shaoxiangyii TaxID=2566013 RepID=UPI001ABDD1B2|nr:carboxyltransferase domain-containing protein [Cellulomonas shaoxiangyii]
MTADARPAVRALPYGDDGLLLELADLAAVRAVDAALRAAPPDGVVDVVPAARTVLVRGRSRTRARWADAVRAVGVAAVAGAGTGAGPGRVVAVPVVYDGPDLDEVAALAGRSAEEVVARHLAGGPDGYRVAFGGFMPGFAYVAGLDPVLHVTRRDTPRTRVPTGSVAVAGEFTAVYPAPTPGGWRLLGTTTTRLFDPARGRAGAALLAPGDVVQFVRATPPAVHGGVGPTATADARTVAAPGATPPGGPRAPDGGSGTTPAPPPVPAPIPAPGRPGAPDAPPRVLTVVATGPLVLVQDLGRPGLAGVGVPPSGAADPDAARAANRLVGNAAGAAVLEVLLGGLVVTFAATTAVALTGAPAPARLDGRPVGHGVPVRAAAGTTLALAAPPDGLRTWVAVRGGLDVPPVLGSRAHDQLSGLGPAPVRAGDVLAYGTAFDGLPVPPGPPDPRPAGVTPSTRAPTAAYVPAADVPSADVPAADAPVVDLPAVDGPRLDHLDAAGRAALRSTVWTVSPASNRVAVRLDGSPLTRAATGELPSEGLVAGAVQVPHDGRPVLFGADHPVTGGYPVVAVLTRDGRARAAQLRPGDRVRLALAPPG